MVIIFIAYELFKECLRKYNISKFVLSFQIWPEHRKMLVLDYSCGQRVRIYRNWMNSCSKHLPLTKFTFTNTKRNIRYIYKLSCSFSSSSSVCWGYLFSEPRIIIYLRFACSQLTLSDVVTGFTSRYSCDTDEREKQSVSESLESHIQTQFASTKNAANLYSLCFVWYGRKKAENAIYVKWGDAVVSGKYVSARHLHFFLFPLHVSNIVIILR